MRLAFYWPPGNWSAAWQESNRHPCSRERTTCGPPLPPEWTLPSRLADNPLVWMLQVNGLMIDIRQAPADLQRLAYEKGLIPFVPPKRSDVDA